MNIAITGGTGSLGFSLTKRLVKFGNYVTVISRDAHKQAAMMNKLPSDRINYVLCDVCSRDALEDAIAGHDIIIHAAALKRVERGISDAAEYTRVNIYGTETVANAASSVGIPKSLFISTDKSPSALNFYGKTKAVAESIWLSKNSTMSRFSAVRYGNVMGSNGSVWEIWNRLLKEGECITVRAPEPTRFFMTINDAVNLVINSMKAMIGGEIFVPKNMPAFSMFDLARYAASEESWNVEALLPGEKQHEILVAPDEFLTVYENSDMAIISQSSGNRSFETPANFDSSRTPNRISAEDVVRRLNENSS